MVSSAPLRNAAPLRNTRVLSLAVALGVLSLGAGLGLAEAHAADGQLSAPRGGIAPRGVVPQAQRQNVPVARVVAYTQPSASSAAGPFTGLQLAARHGLTYEDAGTYVMLEGRNLRVRMYPGRMDVVVAGNEYRVKDRISRNGRSVLLTGRVAGFLSRQIETFFARERQRRAVRRTSTVRRPLPPLPRRTVVSRVPRLAVEKEPVPVPAPAPVAASGPAPGDASWVPPVAARKWRWIIVHHSDDDSGSVAKYDRFHRYTRGWENGCGYHFVIGNGTETGDGEIEMGPRWTQQLQGAHAKTPDNRFNELGIGICLVGDFHDHGGRPTEAQLASLARLIRWLRDRFDIRLDDVRGHCDCCSTSCPGRYFPWDELRRRIR